MTVGVDAPWRLPQQRCRMIAEYIDGHESATIKELSEVFGMSAVTKVERAGIRAPDDRTAAVPHTAER